MALDTYRQGLNTPGGAGHRLPHVGMAHVGLAEVLYERDELGRCGTERVALSQQIVTLLDPVSVWRARLLLSNREVAAAARWADDRGLRAGDERGYPREGECLVLARVLLAEHTPGRALGCSHGCTTRLP